MSATLNQSETTPISISPPARSQRGWTVVLLLAFVYFAVRTSFYALNIAPNVPPDERAHFGISEVFAKTWGFPVDSEESYRFGLITHVPVLYYYLMGRVANLNFLFDSDLPLLRLTNALMGILTVWVGYLWMRRITGSRLAACLFVVVVTNIPMFTFLCGSVNYDNFINLVSALGVYFLTRFFESRRPAHLGAFFIALCLGALTKVAFVPLAGILCIALLVHEWRNLGKLPTLFAQSLSRWSIRGVLLTIIVLTLIAANVSLYSRNLARYGLLVPVVQQVLTQDQSIQNPVFARDYITAAFRDGRITVAEAMAMTDKIDDPSNKQATIAMLNEAMKFRKHDEPRTPPPVEAPAAPPKANEKALIEAQKLSTTAKAAATGDSPQVASRPRYFVFWTAQLAGTTFGVLGQLSIFKPTWQLGVYAGMFALGLLVFVVTQLVPRWRRQPDFVSGLKLYLLVAVTLAYVAVLFRHNYGIYSRTGTAELAVQGRYLFPVMLPMYGLLVCYLLLYWPRRIQWLITVATAAWFIAGDFPFFLSHATPEWFTAPATGSEKAMADAGPDLLAPNSTRCSDFAALRRAGRDFERSGENGLTYSPLPAFPVAQAGSFHRDAL